MADRASTSGAQAYLNVLSIDADLLKRQDKQCLFKKVKDDEGSAKRRALAGTSFTNVP
jgi:acid phosphatase family membrane protein YuiD